MFEPLRYDPFILALGYIALNTPGFESALGNLCATLADSDDVRRQVTGANYTVVRDRVYAQLESLNDAELRAGIGKTLVDCDDIWEARNTVMHGLWIVNAEGHFVITPRRGKAPLRRGAGSVETLTIIARRLADLELEIVDRTRDVINFRRAERGQPPMEGGGLVWRIDP